MIGWLIAALQVAPIAVTCPPDVDFARRPETACIAQDASILTPIIRFSPGHRSLTQRSKRVVNDVAKLLLSKKIHDIEIRVHNREPDQYGYRKTDLHARVLSEALVKLGVPQTRLVARAYGEEQPLTSRTDPAASRVNTRVEIWLMGRDRLRVR